jgi:hypothetical protein
MGSSLPPEFDPLIAELTDTPEIVSALFLYALDLMMSEEEEV